MKSSNGKFIDSFSNPIMDDEMPEGWRFVRFKEICKVADRDHRTPKYLEKGIQFISPKNFTKNGIDFSSLKYVDDAEWENFQKKCNPEIGDILYSRIGTIGESRLINFHEKFVALHSIVLIKPNLNVTTSKFILYLLKSPYMKSQAFENVKSIGTPDLGIAKINNFIIKLPPLAEQQRIVARVEALLSHVDAAGDRLRRVPAIMKRFRQAVLAAACSGRLTEGWREDNPDIEKANELIKRLETIRKQFKSREISPLENLVLPDLPDSWTWLRLSKIAIVMDPDHKMPKSVDNGICFISPKDFKENYQIDITNTKQISDEDFLRLSKKFVPKSTDILYSRIGADLGKARKAPQNIKFHISYSLAVIRQLGEMENSDYLFWLLNSTSIRNQAFDNVRSIGVPDLGLKDIDNFLIPLPPLAEQHEIVRRVGLLFERADAIEREVAAAGRRCERLRRAILVKAFSGRLV